MTTEKGRGRIGRAVMAAAVIGLAVGRCTSAESTVGGAKVIRLDDGPHLFLDNGLIAEKTGLVLTIHHPEKYAGNPILAGKNRWTALDKTSAPGTVMRDPATGGLRMWYLPHSRSGLGYHLGYGIGRDGIHWEFPDLGLVDLQGSRHNNLVMSHVIGGRVLFDPGAANAQQRYKAAFYRHAPKPVGFAVAFSPDGLRWSQPAWIKELDDEGNLSGTGASDVVNTFYDRRRKEFVAVFKMWSRQGDYTVAVKRGTPPPRCGRRILGISRSKDFLRWSKARFILRPDTQDPPTLEFYGMPCVIRRGEVFVGFLPHLIDDAPPDGIGWTELAVSRDGDNWRRIRTQFLPRSEAKAGAPDHAVAWVTEVVSLGEREFIYYGGCDQGHKIGSRSGCLAFLRKDGFASLDAGKEGGRLLSRPVRLPEAPGGGLALNAEAKGGEIRVQLRGRDGVLKGYSFGECDLITSDSISIPVSWRGKGDLPVAEEPVQIEFEARSASLYSFGLGPRQHGSIASGDAATAASRETRADRGERCGMPEFDYSTITNPVWSLKNKHLRDPAALVHDGRIYLFFTYYDPKAKTWHVGMATTKDFLRFSEIKIISPEGYASPGNVIRSGEEWVLCYQQYRKFPHYLCISRSRDLTTWSPPEKIFNTSAENAWNIDKRTIDPYIVESDGRYYCYYVGSTRWGKPKGHNLIGVAGSDDLTHWRDLSPDAPVIGVDFPWEEPDGNENNCVIRTKGRWFMLYSAGLKAQKIAYALSDDLIHWEKKGLCDVPVFEGSSTGFGAPVIIEGLAGPNVYHMLYQGRDSKGHMSFFLLQSEDLVHWR